MSEGTLYDTVWDQHAVTESPTGQPQLFVGLHLIPGVTSPEALQHAPRARPGGRLPERTHATVDHIVPTSDQSRPYGGTRVDVTVDDAQRKALVEGVWDTTALMKANAETVTQTARSLPYVQDHEVPGDV